MASATWTRIVRSPWILYGLAALFLGSFIGLALGLQWVDSDGVDGLILDLVKLSSQILVVGIVGGVVKFWLDGQKALANFRAEVLGQLGDAHREVYASRRAIATAGGDQKILRDAFRSLMDVRSNLGSVRHRVRLGGDVGEGDAREAIQEIRTYLETLIDETAAGVVEGRLAVGPRLDAFVAGSVTKAEDEDDVYQRRFKQPYLRAKQAADPDSAAERAQSRKSSSAR